MAQSKNCSTSCSAFKCGKNAAFRRREGIWCRDSEEPCNIKTCMYPMCMKRRLLPQGVCGETVKRQTQERSLDDDAFDDRNNHNHANPSALKIKGKVRKFSEDDFY